VASKFVEAVDVEGEVGEVGLDVDGSTGGKRANLDEFVAFGGFEENEFGAAGGFAASDFGETQDFFVEIDGGLEVVDAVTGVVEFLDFHSGTNTWVEQESTEKGEGKIRGRTVERGELWRGRDGK